MSNENWMQRIPANRQLCDMVIPGSHDAGVYGINLTTQKAPAQWARCQGSPIYGQALYGSRMFDCRVFLKRNAKKELIPTMGHFGREKKVHKGGVGTLGAYGGTLFTAVDDAVNYVRNFPSEFLILRFSHTYCEGEVGAALVDFVNDPVRRPHIYTEGHNIALCTRGMLAGKVIMVFASEFHTNFSPEDGYLPFHKHADGTQYFTGLCTCGKYAGMTSNMSTVHDVAVKAADKHSNHDRDHLHFVYWQQTMTLGMGNIEKATKKPKKSKVIGVGDRDYTGGAHANLGTYCEEIRDKVNSGNWKLPNVISHDFVTADTCKEVIDLNFAAGNPGVPRLAL